MTTSLRAWLLPEAQRRTLEELSHELEFRSGDVHAKRSAFWTMLTLSAVIASAGVLADSTATVIGAMIIAPLSTPIMGIALAAVKRERNGSVAYVLGGSVLVFVVGMVFSFFLPGSFNLLANSQIAGRVSPGMLDLIAALATGLAGSIALARRDVAAVLPGVAIAISLVPPLAVAGVCFGQREASLGTGALLLFVSNLVSLVLAGMFSFGILGYSADLIAASRRSPRRTKVTLGVIFVVVTVALGLNSAANYLVGAWEETIHDETDAWLEGTTGAGVETVDLKSATFEVQLRTPGILPPTDDLITRLDGKVPDGFSITLVTSVGGTVDAGTIGDQSG
jgi:uncharacterized hydrophobic protein (TIGR00271 family)